MFGPFIALMSSFTWAIGTARYSVMAERHSAFAVNFGRALFGLPLFALTAILVGADIEQLGAPQLGWLSVSIISSYAVGDCAFLVSARRIGVPAALAISSTFPIWSALAGFFFLGESLSSMQGLGLAFAVLGICGVILAGTRSASSRGSSANVRDAREAHGDPSTAARQKMLGYVLAGITSLFWAVNSTALAYVGRGLNAPLANTARMAIALLLIPIAARFFAPGQSLLIGRATFRRFWWVFVVEGYCGALFFMYGLSNSPVALGVTLTSLAPVISVPLALILGLERPSWLKTVGVCTTVAGIALLVGGRS